MSAEDCRRWAEELVEFARVQAAPRRELRQHLRECAACSARWAAERNLSAHLQALRENAFAHPPLRSRREELVGEFLRARRRRVQLPVRWAMAAAAMLLLGLGVASLWRIGTLDSPGGIEPEGQAWAEAAEGYDSGEGFVAVPYTPPLAQGEVLRLVHADLAPVELAHLGVFVDVSDAGEVPADLLVGEDGLPRAVRVSEESQY